jgi:hypothetical protein
MQILHGLRLVYEDQNKAHATKVPMLSKMAPNLDQLEIQLWKEKICKFKLLKKIQIGAISQIVLDWLYYLADNSQMALTIFFIFSE